MLFPGYNYLGPFNDCDEDYLRTHRPVNGLDRAAMIHDLHYSEIIRNSGSYYEAYVKFNEADANFLESIRRYTVSENTRIRVPALIAQEVFSFKRRVMGKNSQLYAQVSQDDRMLWAHAVRNRLVSRLQKRPSREEYLEVEHSDLIDEKWVEVVTHPEFAGHGSSVIRDYSQPSWMQRIFDPLDNMSLIDAGNPAFGDEDMPDYVMEILGRGGYGIKHPTYYYIDGDKRSVAIDKFPISYNIKIN